MKKDKKEENNMKTFLITIATLLGIAIMVLNVMAKLSGGGMSVYELLGIV